MQAVNTPVRRCCRCRQEKPLADFRVRSRATGQRHGDCNRCHAAHTRARRVELRRKDFAWMTSQIHHRRDGGAQRLGAILGVMIDKLGGLDRMTDRWYADFEAAEKEGNHAVVLRTVRALWDMMAAYEKVRHQVERDELNALTDKGLDEELGDHMNDYVVSLLVSAGETDAAARKIVARLKPGWWDGAEL